MDYDEFMSRVNHNYFLASQVLAGSLSALGAVGRAATWQTSIGAVISSHVIQDSFHDIISGLFTGQLANLDRTGHDCVDMEPDGTVAFHEHKTCDVDRTKIWKNQNGSLYHGSAVAGKKPSGLTSQISAAYSLGNEAHRNTKRRTTTLMIFDVHGPGNREAPVAAWQISGDWLMENRLTKSGHATVKVGSFINHGWEVSSNPLAALMGWSAWCESLKNDALIPTITTRAGFVA